MSAVKEEIRKRRQDRSHGALVKRLLEHPEGKALLSNDPEQSALSFAEEIDLLREIKDAKEELLIIKRILKQQERVINKGLKSVISAPKTVSSQKSDPVVVFNQPWDDYSRSGKSKNAERLQSKKRHEKSTEMVLKTVQNNVRAVESILERANEVCEGVSIFVCFPYPTSNVLAQNSLGS